jgi:hypothetical protein
VGVLSFTLYYHPRWEHGLHARAAPSIAVQEYFDGSRWNRFAY